MTDFSDTYLEDASNVLVRHSLKAVVDTALGRGVSHSVAVDQLLCEALLLALYEEDHGAVWAEQSADSLEKHLWDGDALLSELTGETETTPITDRVVEQMKRDKEGRK